MFDRGGFVVPSPPSPVGAVYTQIVEHFVSVGLRPLNPPKLGDFDPEQWLEL